MEKKTHAGVQHKSRNPAQTRKFIVWGVVLTSSLCLLVSYIIFQYLTGPRAYQTYYNLENGRNESFLTTNSNPMRLVCDLMIVAVPKEQKDTDCYSKAIKNEKRHSIILNELEISSILLTKEQTQKLGANANRILILISNDWADIDFEVLKNKIMMNLEIADFSVKYKLSINDNTYSTYGVPLVVGMDLTRVSDSIKPTKAAHFLHKFNESECTDMSVMLRKDVCNPKNVAKNMVQGESSLLESMYNMMSERMKQFTSEKGFNISIKLVDDDKYKLCNYVAQKMDAHDDSMLRLVIKEYKDLDMQVNLRTGVICEEYNNLTILENINKIIGIRDNGDIPKEVLYRETAAREELIKSRAEKIKRVTDNLLPITQQTYAMKDFVHHFWVHYITPVAFRLVIFHPEQDTQPKTPIN